MPFLTQKLPRRLLALFLALSLFAPGSSFGQVLYRCVMSGKVSRGGCCCQRAKLREVAAERARGITRSAKAERPECCKAEDQRKNIAPSLVDEAGTHVQAAALVALLPIELPGRLVAERASVRAKQIRGPPPGEPLFAQHCSFLI